MTNRKSTKCFPVRLVFGCIAQSRNATDKNGIAGHAQKLIAEVSGDHVCLQIMRLDQSRARSANRHSCANRSRLRNETPPTWRTLQLNDTSAKCEDLTCKLLRRSQRNHAAIWIACKKINTSSSVAPTTLGAECRLPLTFWPKLPHPAARFVCDSSPIC